MVNGIDNGMADLVFHAGLIPGGDQYTVYYMYHTVGSFNVRFYYLCIVYLYTFLGDSDAHLLTVEGLCFFQFHNLLGLNVAGNYMIGENAGEQFSIFRFKQILKSSLR